MRIVPECLELILIVAAMFLATIGLLLWLFHLLKVLLS